MVDGSLRKEGWKEVKISVFSQVQVRKSGSDTQDPHPEPEIKLQQHSYQRDYGIANEMGHTNIWKELVGK